jgi:hypothetical protein
LLLLKELLQNGKPIKQEPWRPISAEDRNKDSKGWFDLDGDVELSGFASGVYELRISVKNAGSNNSVQRTAVFGVEQARPAFLRNVGFQSNPAALLRTFGGDLVIDCFHHNLMWNSKKPI